MATGSQSEVFGRDALESVDRAISATAFRAEKALAVARVTFYVVLLLRFFVFGRVGLVGIAITALPLVLGIGFSSYVLSLRRPPEGEGPWVISVSLDAVVAFCALLPNVIWPTPEYAGILNMPDTMGLLVATFASGLRLSLPVAALGGTLNGLSLIALVVIERVWLASHVSEGPDRISMYLVIIAACVALTLIFVSLIRQVARGGALAALRAERARQGLGTLLADHHEISSVLSSAQLNADLVSAKLAKVSAPQACGEASHAARDLVEDLTAIGSAVAKVKSRALGDLTLLEQRAPAHVEGALEDVVSILAKARGGIEFGWVRGDVALPPVMLAGGESALRRVLMIVISNAFEGDGQTRPSRVAVETSTELDTLHIAVVDDGPGIARAVLTRAREGYSGKGGGTGVGLSIVRHIVEASGGELTLANRETGGARVTLDLPVAEH